MQKERTHVLLVEDEEGHIRLMLKAFEAFADRFGMTLARNLADARSSIKEKTPDLLILDYNLPDGKGLELLKEHQQMPLFPVIVLTGFGDEKLAVETLKLGAMDYVVKSAGNLRDIPNIAKRTLREWKALVKQKKTEEALRDSEAKNKAILSAMPDLMFRLSKNGDHLDFYASTSNELYLDPKEFLGKSVTDVLPPDVGEKYLSHIRKTIETGQMQVFDYQLDFPDGPRHFESRMVVSGKNETLTIVRDITKRKKAEDALKAITQTFAAHTGKELFNKVSEHLTKTLDVDYAFVGELLEEGNSVRVIGGAANGSPMESFEYDLADTPCANVMGQSPCAYPSGVQELFPKDHLLVEMGIEGYFGSPLFDSKEKPVGIIVLLHTRPIENQELAENLFKIFSERISAELERMKAEDALNISQQRLELAHEAAGMGMFDWDIINNLAVCNERYFKLFGLEPQAGMLSEGDWLTMVHPDDRERAQKEVQDTLEKRARYDTEYRVVWPDTSVKWVSSKAKVFYDDDGRPYRMIGVMTDIADRKRMQDQLIQSQKMESIGTLAGGIAHDFNNILNAIFGFTYLAKMKVPEGSDAADKLDSLTKAANRATDLVRQILLFSRSGSEGLKPTRVTPVIKEALKLLRASIPATVEMQENIAPTGLIMADPVQIHQILMNLCTNAYHAMQETGGVLGIDLQEVQITADFASTFVDLKPGPHIRLTVSDTGHGMEPSIKDRIFEPYFTTKEKGKGTGLGLSVVHGIVKNYGGEITITSELSRGTTFQVYMPVIQKKEEQVEIADETILNGTGSVLFVDDEKSTVLISTEILESLGYKVTGQTDSQEALKLFREKPDKFDVVITDMTMPKMTGIKMAEEMIGIRPDIPVILCTGFSEGINEEMVKQKGIREFLMKPVAPVNIAKAIHSVLVKSHPGPNNPPEREVT